MWSSKEIGIQFDKPNGIFGQLAKIKNGGEPILTAKDRRKAREERKRDFSAGSIQTTDESQESEWGDGAEALHGNSIQRER